MRKWETHEILGPFYSCDNHCEYSYRANEVVWYEGMNFDGKHIEGFFCEDCASEGGFWNDDANIESGPALSEELQRRIRKENDDE